MAKKRTDTKKAAKKPPAKKKAKPKPATRSTPEKKPPATAKPLISNDQIGFAAGDAWGFLHGKGWQSLAAVKKGVDHPSDTTMLALGWLAREGKLDFETSGRSMKVALRA